MRFLALLRKELRECLPWAFSAATFLLIFGSLTLWNNAHRGEGYPYYALRRYSSGIYGFTSRPSGDLGSLVFISAVGLGLAIGVRQFWISDFTGTWGFTLHRSIHRTAVLAVKICAGLISLIVAVGPVWSYLSWRASLPDYSPVPLPKLCFIVRGLLAGCTGLLSYLGVGLVGLSKAKWYTTKLAGLGFAVWMFVTFTQQRTLWWSFGTLVIGIGVLLYLMWETFLKREF
jgi:hypothetical protein